MGLTTTRYIRWDDPGALKLDGTAGSLYAILKHHLPLIGWSIAFDDPGNYKIAFRNSMAHGGSGGYLRVHDDASFTGAGRVASWQTYEDMTDIDTGTLMCCDDWVWKAREAGGTQGADAVRRCYVIIADERTIYLSTWVGDDGVNPRGINPTPPDATGSAACYTCCMCTAGDIDSSVPGDPGFWGGGMVSDNPSSNTSATVMSSLARSRSNNIPPASTTLKLSRNAVLDPSPTVAVVFGAEFPSGGFGSANNPMIASTDPAMFVPALVADGVTVRGRARGLFVPLNDLATNGGAPMGRQISPFNSSSGLQLATLAGVAGGAASANNMSRLFVETSKSWDDL